MDEVQAELARLRAENERLKKRQASPLRLKVSAKGALSVYGLGRFPVTLYKEQWVRVLDAVDDIPCLPYRPRRRVEGEGKPNRGRRRNGRSRRTRIRTPAQTGSRAIVSALGWDARDPCKSLRPRESASRDIPDSPASSRIKTFDRRTSTTGAAFARAVSNPAVQPHQPCRSAHRVQGDHSYAARVRRLRPVAR